MHQCLEWEPSGSFYQAKESQVNGISTNSGSTVEMASRIPQLPAMTDPSLPPNPRKAVLYRPVVTHFLAVSIIGIDQYYNFVNTVLLFQI